MSAWAPNNRLMLGQVKTEERSNEIVAVPRLLDIVGSVHLSQPKDKRGIGEKPCKGRSFLIKA